MSDIRKAITTRYPFGRLVELDFSQLEIYALAFLSDDEQLKEDLLSGADLHGISAENLFGWGYSQQQRKIAKQLSFQLQYGAGAKSMAKSNDIPESLAKEFIENYYRRYTGVKEYHTRLIHEINVLRTPSEKRSESGLPVAVSELVSQTGRIYEFTENDAPDWMQKKGVYTSFSPTKIKNYPVQGFATGDIVPMILGKLYRALQRWDVDKSFILMINTVHDSVLFDCEFEIDAIRWAKHAKRIMEAAPKYLKEIYDIDFDLPLPVEAQMGKDWHDMEVLDI